MRLSQLAHESLVVVRVALVRLHEFGYPKRQGGIQCTRNQNAWPEEEAWPEKEACDTQKSVYSESTIADPVTTVEICCYPCLPTAVANMDPRVQNVTHITSQLLSQECRELLSVEV